jgi:hypothetical protein
MSLVKELVKEDEEDKVSKVPIPFSALMGALSRSHHPHPCLAASLSFSSSLPRSSDLHPAQPDQAFSPQLPSPPPPAMKPSLLPSTLTAITASIASTLTDYHTMVNNIEAMKASCGTPMSQKSRSITVLLTKPCERLS